MYYTNLPQTAKKVCWLVEGSSDIWYQKICYQCSGRFVITTEFSVTDLAVVLRVGCNYMYMYGAWCHCYFHIYNKVSVINCNYFISLEVVTFLWWVNLAINLWFTPDHKTFFYHLQFFMKRASINNQQKKSMIYR